MSNGNAEFRGLALADPVSLVPQFIPGQYGYWVVYLPLATPPNTISVYPGDTVRFNVRFQHRGAGVSYGLYCAMGVRHLSIFDEDPLITKQKSIHLNREDTWVTHTETIDIPIPSNYTGYGWKDIYAKIMLDGKNMAISPEYDNCIQIAKVVPEFQLVEITKYETV